MGGLDTEIGADDDERPDRGRPVRRDDRSAGRRGPSGCSARRATGSSGRSTPSATEWASRRCAELILEVAGGTLHPGVIDVGAARAAAAADHAAARPDRAGPRDRDRPRDGRADPARRWGWSRCGEPTGVARPFRPPSWRSDLEREIDLIEEVARIHGYEHIPEDRPVPLASAPRGARERVEARGPRRADRLRVRRGGHLQPRRRRAGRAARARRRPRRRSGSSIRAASARTPCGRAWSRACWPSAGTTRRTATPTPSCSRSPTSTCPGPAGRSPTSRPGWPWSPGATSRASRGSSRRCWRGSHRPATWRSGPSVPPLRPGPAGRAACVGEPTWAISARSTATGSTPSSCAGPARRPSWSSTSCSRPGRAGPTAPSRCRRSRPWSATSRWSSRGRSPGPSWPRGREQAAGPTLESIDYLDTFRGGNVPEGRQSVHFGLRFRHPERTLTGEEVERAVRAIVGACAARFDATLRVSEDCRHCRDGAIARGR